MNCQDATDDNPVEVVWASTQEVPSTIDLANQIMHVLAPRNTRITLQISFPHDDPYVQISSAIISAIKAAYSTYYIEILEIAKGLLGIDKTNYTVRFIIIPNEMIDKIREVGIRKCIFYVGLSEDNQSFPILNGKPPDSDLALTNYEGEPSPYISGLITL